MYVALLCLMDPKGLKVTQYAYFSLLTHTKELLLVTFCDMTAGLEKMKVTYGRTYVWKDRQT